MSHFDSFSAIDRISPFWDLPDGFLYRLRQGYFDPEGAADLEAAIQSLRASDIDCLSRRLVSLTWPIPTFMEWQVERVEELGGDVASLRNAIIRIRNALDGFLGVP